MKVSGTHVPELSRLLTQVELRFATLDVLCRFVGYPSFAEFLQALKDDPAE